MSDPPARIEIDLTPRPRLDLAGPWGPPGPAGPQGPPGAGWDADEWASIDPNLLSAAASGFEDGTTAGWAPVAGVSTIANTTAAARTGTRSLEISALANNPSATYTVGLPAALVGLPVRVTAWTMPSPGQMAATARVTVTWLTAASATIGATVLGAYVTQQAGTWVASTLSAVPPPTAAQARIAVASTGGLGDAFLVDDVVITGAAVVAGDNVLARLAALEALQAPNLLGASASGFEDPLSLGGWTATGATLANTGTTARTGTRSLQVTATGGAVAQPTLIAPLDPSLAGRPITITAWFQPTVAGRQVRITAWFQTAAGGNLGTQVVGDYNGPGSLAGQWTRVVASAVAPAGTARMILYVAFAGPPGAGEISYLDDVTVTARATSLRYDMTVSGTYTVTVPAWATSCDAVVIGGGGGGGGGGSSSGVAAQAGGAGGAGATAEATSLATTAGMALVCIVGNGGAGSAGGAAGGGGGGAATNGTESQIYLSGDPNTKYAGGGAGRGGSPSTANSATAVAAGVPGATGILSPAGITQGFLGIGGASAQWAQGGGFRCVGGSGGGASTATNGGGSGGALQATQLQNSAGPGAAGASPDVNGLAGQAATQSGCGGGGGGGGAQGGAGGAGGAGAPGRVILVFRA